MKQARYIFLFIIIILIISWVYLMYFSNLNNINEDIREAEQAEIALTELEVKYPAVYGFTKNYFQTIQAGNYEELSSTYWNDGVIQEIKLACSNPLADEEGGLIENLWRICAYFDSLNIEIVNILATNGGYDVTVQFYDDSGEIIGIDVHPEWVSGHHLFVDEREKSIFSTSDWRFLQ